MHILENKTISSMKIAEDKKAILFIVDEKEIIARADGDCCSYSWIENIELPVNGFPAKVLSIEDLGLPQTQESCENDEVIIFYGLKITTDKGDIVIDYRNSSNGYYGGNLVFGDEYFYGGVHGQNASKFKWKEIE